MIINVITTWLILFFCISIIGISNIFFRWRTNYNIDQVQQHNIIFQFSLFHSIMSLLLLLLALVGLDKNHHDLLLLSLFMPVLLWRPLTEILVTCMIRLSSSSMNGGPLGIGYKKMMEVFSGYILCTIFHNTTYRYIDSATYRHHSNVTSSTTATKYGGMNRLLLPNLSFNQQTILWYMILIGIGFLVNFVLWIWSRYYFIPVQQRQHKTRTTTTTATIDKTNHTILANLIPHHDSHKISYQHHLLLLLWSFLNASCEEYTSRYFWRNQYYTIFYQFQLPNVLLVSNVGQAIIFGCWHYYGIPNGLPGVVLTFVYGMIMGYISDYDHHRLVHPILLHTIADYYIFAYIVRRQQSSYKEKS